MKMTPLKRYSEPCYPIGRVVEEHPELLNLIPRRWQCSPPVLAVLAGACLLFPLRRAAAEVAPLAGDVMAPLVILTEEEARQVIVDEAKKSGINFAADKKTVRVNVPSTDSSGKQKTQEVKLVLDGTDKKHNISYEYVSEEDVNGWRKRYPKWPVAMTPKSAESLKQAMEKSEPKQKFGVFSDPQSWSKEDSREELRRQVRDFVKWLKTQGVI